MADDDVREDDEREEGDADEGGEGDETESSTGTGTSDASDDGEGEGESESDEGAAESDAPAAASASASTAVEKAKKAAAGSKMSAGARLAAAKAAKAAKKAAKKQAIREAEAVDEAPLASRAAVEDPDAQAEEMLRESPLGRAATQAGAWAEANRQMAIGAAVAILLALGGWAGWNYYSNSQAAAAGVLLDEALRISAAPVITAGESEGSDEEGPSYESSAARNEAALTAYRRVISEYPSSAAAAYARLGEGRTLLEQGEYDDARTAYEAAFHASASEPVVAWQSLEGIAATYEAQENWAEATATYERLQSLNDGAYADVAAYHLARMHAAQGDETAALTAFRELVDRMREHSADDGEPPFPYVLAQAEVRLHELDPSAPGGGPEVHGGPGGEGGNPLEGLTPEQIQELIQRFQTKSGGSGAAPE